jgi:hypothetical protein
MKSRKGIQSRSFAWPLAKAAGFWFVFAQAAEFVAPAIATSPRVFAYVAIAGFGVQALGLFLGSVMAYGFSWRIGVIAIVGAALGFGIFSTLPTIALDNAATPNWLSHAIESAWTAGGLLGEGPVARTPPPNDQLGSTAQLVFSKETQESLAAARRFLLSIPERSPVYKSAQALLAVVERRLEEIKTGKNADREETRPIHIISIEQTGHGLRVRLRNNTGQPVESIRYRISYFRMADGMLLEPDKESLMLIDIPPHVTWSFELNDEQLKHGVFGAFQVLGWNVEP